MGKNDKKTDAPAPQQEHFNIADSINELETGDLETSIKAATDLGRSGKPEAMKPLIIAVEEYADLEDVMDFVQKSGRITLHMDADKLRKDYRNLSIATNTRDSLYKSNAVGYFLWLYMDDRDNIENMKKEAKKMGYSVVDPY